MTATPKHRSAAPSKMVVVLAMLIASCSAPNGDTSSTGAGSGEPIIPDPTLPIVTVNVTITDTEFIPSTIFLPAGQRIRLVVRNRGTDEHHFRVAGLIPAQLGWQVQPEISLDDIEAMSPEELAELGLTAEDAKDADHVLHHLSPTLAPFKGESRAGITPLPNEVHAYADWGQNDIVTFFATNTGRFHAEDVLHPEITGVVVVYEAAG